jgi:hypothetical protein
VGTENFLDAPGGAARDLRDLGARRCWERTERELAALVITNVDAVQGEHVGMDIQPQSGISTLNGRHASRLRIDNALEPERVLGTKPERTAELFDERADDFGAEFSVIAQQRAQAPR